MNLKHVKWDQYILTSEPPLPHDVTFRVFSMEDESIFQEVSAHRLLLAAASEVFHAQFFGALASTQKVVEIRETTFKAFKFLLLYIYWGIDVKIDAEDSHLDELMEILNLAEKYGMVQLVNEISIVLREDLVITEENVLEVTETAQTYSCFETAARILTEKCQHFFKKGRAPEVELEEVTEERTTAVSPVKGWISPEKNPNKSEKLKMSLSSLSWVEFLNEDSSLPSDITFKFYEKTKTLDGGGKMVDVKKFVGQVKAHKLLLASCSQVFKESFFNPSLKDTTDELVIEDSSLRAFRIMIDFIYGRFPKLRGGPDICEMFEIENVADRYRVAGLKEEYKSSMLLYFRYR